MESSFPQIFQTEDLAYEDRFSVYWDEILQYCKPGEVRERVAKYVAQHVSASEWRAVWRSTPASNGTQNNCDIVVEVSDVDVDTMTAEIAISHPVVCDCTQSVMEMIKSHLMNAGNSVPLVELYPVYDESGEFDETALAIEHVRFFYDHLWREWDDDDDSDYFYAARNLETRLRLFYDMNDGTLPKELVNKYKTTYQTYKQKLSELNSLRQEMGANDSEQEFLDDVDVLRCVQKSDECEALVHSLQIIENPQMRYLLASITPSVSVSGEQALQQIPAKGPRQPGGLRITMIVAPELKAFMTSTLPGETVVEHYRNLDQAIENSYEGDTILVYSGVQMLNSPCLIKDSVVIAGVGDPVDITVRCSSCTDYAIECQANKVHFRNIKFAAVNEDVVCEGIIKVLRGHTTLEECSVHGTRVVLRAAIVSATASLTATSCQIQGALIAGLSAVSGSSLVVSKTDISNNGKGVEHPTEVELSHPEVTGGIQLQVQPNSETLQVILDSNTIHNNSGFGVCVSLDTETSSDMPRSEVGLALTMKDNNFINNTAGDVDSIVEANS